MDPTVSSSSGISSPLSSSAGLIRTPKRQISESAKDASVYDFDEEDDKPLPHSCLTMRFVNCIHHFLFIIFAWHAFPFIFAEFNIFDCDYDLLSIVSSSPGLSSSSGFGSTTWSPPSPDRSFLPTAVMPRDRSRLPNSLMQKNTDLDEQGKARNSRLQYRWVSKLCVKWCDKFNLQMRGLYHI